MDWVLRFTGFSFLFLLSPLFFKYARCTDELFTKVGARNWKKLSEKLTKHASSQVHLSSMEMWESYKQTATSGSVAAQLSHSHQSTVQKNRVYVQICWYHKTASQTRPAFPRTPWKCWCRNKGELFELMRFFSKYDPDSNPCSLNILTAQAEIFRMKLLHYVQSSFVKKYPRKYTRQVFLLLLLMKRSRQRLSNFLFA